jgi:hypothetical protein
MPAEEKFPVKPPSHSISRAIENDQKLAREHDGKIETKENSTISGFQSAVNPSQSKSPRKTERKWVMVTTKINRLGK